MSSASEDSVPSLDGPPSNTLTPAADTPEGEKELVEETEKLVIVKDKDIGMIACLKHLYSSKEDKRGKFTWQTKLPEDLGKPAEDADTLKHAIIARYIRVYGDPRRVLELHSIVIQSPLIKDFLAVVLDDYPGVTVELERLEFSGDFEPLIHRWANLEAEIQKLRENAGKEDVDEQAADRIRHAELLYDLLQKEFKDTISSSQDMIKKGVITYDLLWTVFQPGTLVYSKLQGQDRVYVLNSEHYGRDRDGSSVLWISLQFVDYDGICFGTSKLNLSISSFTGTKALSLLAVTPLESLESKESLRAKLIERGGKVEGFAGCHYRAYNGIGWRVNTFNQIEKHTVKGRVVLDAQGWNRFNPNASVFVVPFHLKDSPSPAGYGSGEPDDDGGWGGPPSWADGLHLVDDENSPVDENLDDDDQRPKHTPLTDEQKLICTPVVRGYSLKDKEWLNMFVNNLYDITFNTKAFESLVLPGDEKELIMGFASTPEAYRRQFDDVVEGKGRGMIILLSGPPGTGKTLTAEGVAEEMKTPLYVMSAGDLGTEARHVESGLRDILAICTRWNAILLLDEADVFLEERSLHEIQRNGLVSIFLRLIVRSTPLYTSGARMLCKETRNRVFESIDGASFEYFQGNMILTTNRVQTFDPAFQSRILISIDYKELTVDSRRTVWANFLKQHDITQTNGRANPPKQAAGDEKANDEIQQQHVIRTLPHEISESDIDNLARTLTLNGRQIKNVLKTAQLLALRRGEGLKKDHIKLVLKVTQHLHNSTREKENTRSAIFS